MTHDEAEKAIRAEMALHSSNGHARSFWKGVLVGLGCGVNLDSLPMELLKDLANKQGTTNNPVAYP